MVVKCQVHMNTTKFKKNISLSCSERMAEYLDSVTDENNNFDPIIIEDDECWAGFRVDTSIAKTIRKIANETLDIGDKLLADEYASNNSIHFERQDYDFYYEKKVIDVKDRWVYMRSNEGKEFSIPMNDYLYLCDKPKKNDVVRVVKFLNGKSFVTKVTERYTEPALDEYVIMRD